MLYVKNTKKLPNSIGILVYLYKICPPATRV